MIDFQCKKKPLWKIVFLQAVGTTVEYNKVLTVKLQAVHGFTIQFELFGPKVTAGFDRKWAGKASLCSSFVVHNH